MYRADYKKKNNNGNNVFAESRTYQDIGDK